MIAGQSGLDVLYPYYSDPPYSGLVECETEVVWGMAGGGKAKVVHRIRSIGDRWGRNDVVCWWCGARAFGRPGTPAPVLMRSKPDGVPMCRGCMANEHRWIEQPAFRVLIDEQGNAL